MYDVILQPITSESNIPFDKILLLSDGSAVFTGKLQSITAQGHQFKTTEQGDFMSLFTTSVNKPTHYTILNIKLEK